jgi:lipoprotein-releasing system permease protein
MSANLPFFIALRYFFSKKSQRVINIISVISAMGVMIGTAALIIVLSVFNGFEDLIIRLYNSFDPDLRIELAAGKSFHSERLNTLALGKIEGIENIAEVIEESALIRYRDKQYIVKLKGVSEGYEKMVGLDTMIVDGTFMLQHGDTDFAVIGGGIAYNLGLQTGNFFNQVEIYGPKNSEPSLTDPEGAFNRRYISPSGIFAVQQEFDAKYVLVPLRFAREIFDFGDKLTSVEIHLKKGSNEKEIIRKISSIAGSDFKIKTRFQQHEIIYKIMRSERWAVFLILTFILIIAIFNVISSLTMLVIEKKKDIIIFRSMGAEVSFLRKVFLTEGMFITLTGALAGLFIGAIICYIQETYGLITLGGSGSFVIDAYPVKMAAMDFAYVFITVSCIGLLAAWYPARRLIRPEINLKMIAGEE